MSTLDFYKVEVDLNRNNAYNHPASDMTRLVQFAGTSWESGIMDRRYRVGRPTRMVLNVSNDQGQFYTTGINSVVNGDFGSWSGDNPLNWTMTNPEDGSNYITRVERHQFGNPYYNARFVSDGWNPTVIEQDVLEIGREYIAQVVIENYTQGTLILRNDGQADLASFTGNGSYTIYFTATGENVALSAISSIGTPTALDVKSISVTSRYPYADIHRGMNIRVQMRAHEEDSYTTIWQGKVKSILKDWWRFSTNPAVQLMAEDQRTSLDMQTINMQLQKEVRSDQALLDVMNQVPVPWPYQKTYAFFDDITLMGPAIPEVFFFDAVDYCDFDEGAFIVPWFPDIQDNGRGVSPIQLIEQITEAEIGRFFWDGKTGKFVFHNRHHDYGATVAYAFDGTQVGDVVTSSEDDLINVQEVQFYPRRIGSPNTALYEPTNLPLKIAGGEDRKIVARYTDVAGSDDRVFAYGPVKVPFTASFQEEGDGFEASHVVWVSKKESSTSVEITFHNTGGADVYIQSFSVKGQPLYVSAPETYTGYAEQSARDYERQVGRLMSLDLVTEEFDAKNRAQLKLQRYKNPVQRVRSFTVSLMDETPHFNEDMLALNVGDIVRLVNPTAVHDRKYSIHGIRHLPEPDKHRMEFIVTDYDDFRPAIFDGITKFDGASYFAP